MKQIFKDYAPVIFVTIWFLLVILIPSITHGAVTLIATSSESAYGTMTTASINTTGADFIVIGLSIDNGYNGTPTDSKGNTWVQASTTYTNTNARVRMWYTIPTSVGTGHTFSVPANPVGAMYVQAFSGVKQISPEDKINGSNGFATTFPVGSITPSEDNELIVTAFSVNGTGASPMSIDSGFTETSEEPFVAGTSYGGAMAYKIQTTATAVNPTWTRSDSNGSAVMQVSFKMAIVATSTVVYLTEEDMASTTAQIASLNFGLTIIIVIMFIGIAGYIFNSFRRTKKSWQ